MNLKGPFPDMYDSSRRRRRFLVRLVLVIAVVFGVSTATTVNANGSGVDNGRPIPGAPSGTADVAEGVGGVDDHAPVAESTNPNTVALPPSLNCGALTPVMMAAAAAGMLFMYVPVRRIR